MPPLVRHQKQKDNITKIFTLKSQVNIYQLRNAGVFQSRVVLFDCFEMRTSMALGMASVGSASVQLVAGAEAVG